MWDAKTQLGSPQLDSSPLGGERAILSPALVCGINVIAAVFLQRIVIPLGDQADISVLLPLAAASIGYLFMTGAAVIDTPRLIACLAFLAAAVISQVFGGNDFSMPSLVLLIALYIILPVRIGITAPDYARILVSFQYAMVAIAVATMAQYAVQLNGGPMPILEDVVPETMIVKDFVYLQEVMWSSGLMKPNGIFMLEPSFLSQFLALALIIEFWCFRRLLYILLFSGVLVVTFSGTGMLLATIMIGVMALRRGVSRHLIVVGAAAGFVVVGLVLSGWFGAITGRVDEFSDPDASASLRFEAPFIRVYKTLTDGDPMVLLFGVGAGTIEEVGFAWNPPVKVWIEYGVIVCLLYMIFMLTVFRKAPLPMLALALALEYFFFGGGSLLQPQMVCLCFFLACGYAAIAARQPGISLRANWQESRGMRSLN